MKTLAITLAAAAALTIAMPANAATTVYNGAGFAIPDVSTGQSTITVAGGSTVNNVTFTLDRLSHTYISDLVATLTHNGVTYNFLNNDGNGNDLGGTYTISDLGTTTLAGNGGDPVPSGTYRGNDLLSAFNGASSTGDWTLKFVDNVGRDSGNLAGWSLSIGTAGTGAVPEPATWAMMIVGFGLMGGALRRRQSNKVAFAA